ncbi:MAG: hypothetical protein Kow00123_21480 [Anaerolineales bacterium]
MKRAWRLGIVLVLTLALAGCAYVGRQNAAPSGFVQARDAAVSYVKMTHPDLNWPASFKWTAEDITAGRLGATTWKFSDPSGLSVVVSLPVVPDALYSVEVSFGDFAWSGKVDATGKVAQEPTPAPSLTAEAARDAAVAHFLSLYPDLSRPDEWIEVDAAGGLLGITALRYIGGDWTVDVQAPVVPKPEYAVRVAHASGKGWVGRVFADGTVGLDEGTTFLADDTRPTRILEAVRTDPKAWAGKYIRVVGYYEGWDLFGSVGTGPAVTRSDWVIRDDGGAIYVHAGGAPVDGLDIPPSEKVENVLLRLFAQVRVNDAGQPYLWVVQGTRIGPATQVLLEYERSGGFAGFMDRLTVYADGRAVLNRKGLETTFRLTPEEMARLTGELASAQFTSLDEAYLPSDPCCDRFTYVIRYMNPEGGKPHTVKTMDGTIPPQLVPVLEMLNNLVSR